MDPSKFPVSRIPLKHAPYGPITPENLKDANKGKVAVITGAGRGIGQAIATSLADSGADVAILDLKLEGLDETRKTCEEKGVKVKAFACDVVDEARVKEVFTQIEKDLGPVDVLVNNAGVLFGRPASMINDFSAYWRAVEVNFKGPMLCTLQVLNGMRERRKGCIITIASRAATVDTMLGLGYNDAKAGVTRAVHCLQLELDLEGLGEDVYTYALHPGGVLTDMGAKAHAPDVLEKYPDMFEKREEFMKLFKDPPILCGQTCAYLATGKAKEIKGMYFDCRQDIEVVCGYGRERLEKEGMYNLKVDFCEGYGNEP